MSLDIAPILNAVWSWVSWTWQFIDSITIYESISLLDLIVAFTVLSIVCSLLFSIHKGGDEDDDY